MIKRFSGAYSGSVRGILLALISCLSLVRGLNASALHDTTFLVNKTPVTIHYPSQKSNRLILMLPGWNFSKDKTCEQSDFCKKALEQGYVLVCPEMGKSLYASAAYPQTRKDWLSYPQLKFITDTLQPLLQNKFGLLKQEGLNFIYGISTGSRGGALILEHSGTLYKAAALLSGDYNQCLDPKDNLMNGFYGSYAVYKDRWEGEDNPFLHLDKIHAKLYIGHGRKDAVVPFIQSEQFSSALIKQGIVVKTSFPENAGHNYEFWGKETDAVLDFFKSCWGKE